MRNCGLVNRVRDTAAFFQLLSFSSWHLAILRNDGEEVSSLKYAGRASRELQKQICDPNMCTTVELILAILVFASSSVSLHARADKNSPVC
jgi:Fungal specific transcription factor domain